MPSEGEGLNPCGLTIDTNIDKAWKDQKSQSFYCHAECFRKMANDDGVMYFMEPDFSTNGECDLEGD